MAVQLGPVTLDHLTDVRVRDRARVARHAVPALAGDLVQQLGRSSVELSLTGSFFGPDAATQLAALREAFRSEQQLDLLADSAADGYVANVVLTSLDVSQQAGHVDRFDYRIELVEYVRPPAPAPLDALQGIDQGLAQEAAGYIDDVQDGLAQVSQLVALTQIAGFGDPTAKAPAMVTNYEEAGGGSTEPATAIRDLLSSEG
ncbi:DNA circularization N-terminal domain-containing protein [Actinopolymorpha pittospori]